MKRVGLLVVVGGVVVLTVVGNAAKSFKRPTITIPNGVVDARAKEVFNELLQQKEQDKVEQSHEARLTAAEASVEGAIADWQALLDNTVCVRAVYYLDSAREWQGQTGGSMEKWLTERLTAQQKEAQTWVVSNTSIPGSADGQAQARAIVVDNLALLEAMDALYKNEGVPVCQAKPVLTIAKLQDVLVSTLARIASEQQTIKNFDSQQKEVAQQEGQDGRN